MGAAQQVEIFGAKGGSDKPKTPTEAPDSLRSVAMVKILIAMGEGEFAGNPTAQDIFLDNTPLQDPQGNMNFPNVKWEFRSGSVEQSFIQGIPSIENETSLGIELRSGRSWVRAISNTELSAARLRFAWPALQSVDASGNVNGYRIEYKVELSTDGGAYQQVLSEAVDGKTTSTYEQHPLHRFAIGRQWLADARDPHYAQPVQQQNRRHDADSRLHGSHRRKAAVPEHRAALHRVLGRAVP